MVDPIEGTFNATQNVNVRLYFPKDMDPETIRAKITAALQSDADMTDLISAYELVSDGFGRLVPDSKPLA
jgi:hypothetical protein